MNAMPVHRPDQITARWLTAALQRSGVLNYSRVEEIQMAPNEADNSQVVHLQVSYYPQIEPGAPTALLAKLNQDGDGAAEVDFYLQAMQQPTFRLPMLARCYYAAMDAHRLQSCLLLQDISGSHSPPVNRQALIAGDGMPSMAVMESIITALAGFHAWWWERPCSGEAASLTRVRDWYASQGHHSLHVERRERELEYFLACAGPDFPVEMCEILKNALCRLHGLWERYLRARVREYRQLTLAHGDCYLTNILAPNDGAGQVYLVDFDSASGNFAAFDLVYLLATFWRRSQRLEEGREQALLATYHRALTDYGVRNYSYQDLLLDYRLMLCYVLFDPVADLVRGSPRSYWWPKLSRLMAAYQDWGCAKISV